jgi:hypothetical protein
MSAAAIPSMARAIGVRLTSEPPVNRRLETSNLGGRARTAPSYRRLGRRKHAEQPEKALEAARPRRCGRSPAPRARSRPAPITPRPGVRAERASGSLPRMKSARPASFTSAGPDLRPPAGGVAAAGGLHPGLGVGLAPLLCLCVTRREPRGTKGPHETGLAGVFPCAAKFSGSAGAVPLPHPAAGLVPACHPGRGRRAPGGRAGALTPRHPSFLVVQNGLASRSAPDPRVSGRKPFPRPRRLSIA